MSQLNIEPLEVWDAAYWPNEHSNPLTASWTKLSEDDPVGDLKQEIQLLRTQVYSDTSVACAPRPGDRIDPRNLDRVRLHALERILIEVEVGDGEDIIIRTEQTQDDEAKSDD